MADHTQSGFNPCHANMPQLIDAVQRGVMLSGALPVPFPTISLHESFAHPTSMFLRNLMSMDTEEMIRAQPMDAVILIGGCDKTVPAQLMGAISADVPAVQLVVGPMVTGSHRGTRVGACTDCRGYWGRYRAGEIDIEEIGQVGNELVPSAGTCGVMGTGKCHRFDLCCTPTSMLTSARISLNHGLSLGSLGHRTVGQRLRPGQLVTATPSWRADWETRRDLTPSP